MAFQPSLSFQKKSKRFYFSVLSLIAIGLYIFIPAVSQSIHHSLSILSKGEVQALRTYLLSFGPWAPLISGLLMLLQAIIAPLPAFVITIANGMLFGCWWGGLLSWISAMAAALMCFYIATNLGRPIVERLVSRKGLLLAEQFFEKYGVHAIIFARLIPIVPFDPISYGAGLTRMPIRNFVLSTGLGMLPGTIAYSWLGENLEHTYTWILGATGLLILVFGSLLFRLYIRRKLEKQPYYRAQEETKTPSKNRRSEHLGTNT